MTIEEHPLEPFLPVKAKILFLGSFPPPRARWSMEFFYPNWINDFWRVMGLIHFGDKQYFEDPPLPSRKETSPLPSPKERELKAHKFDKKRIVEFCEKEGLAFFDTARKVCRLKDNADDNFLKIVEGTDVFALLEKMPECRTVVTTGGKASEELQAYFSGKGVEVKTPKVGEWVEVASELISKPSVLRWWRMPSTSRAYPMKVEKKVEYYRRLWE